MIEFLKCINNKMENPHYALYLIDDPLLDEKKTELDVCQGDFNVTDNYCFKKCVVNYYNVGIKMNFLRNFKQALKGILKFKINKKSCTKLFSNMIFLSIIKKKKDKQHSSNHLNIQVINFSQYLDFLLMNTIWKNQLTILLDLGNFLE